MSNPHFDSITDPIAVDCWKCKRGESAFTARIEVGRPIPAAGDPNGDWCCPVFIEKFNDRVTSTMGVSPVDALLNAVSLIRMFAEELDEWAPRATDDES
jgi:hypothetical protein